MKREREKKNMNKGKKNKDNLKSLSSFSLYKFSITIIAWTVIIQESNVT